MYSELISDQWPLSIPLKKIENQRFSDVFRGYKNRPVA